MRISGVPIPAQAGNSGKVLTTDGSKLNFSAPSAVGALKLVSTTAVSGTSSGAISVTNSKQYLVKIVITSGSTIDVKLTFNASATGYKYRYFGYAASSGTVVTAGSAAATSILLMPSANNPSTEQNVYVDFYMYPQGTTSTKQTSIMGFYIDTIGAQLLNLFGSWSGSADITSFTLTGTNSWTGTVYLYEIATS